MKYNPASSNSTGHLDQSEAYDLSWFVREYWPCAHILVQPTIYCRLLIDRDSHLDQSEAYDIATCTIIRALMKML